MRGYYFYFVSAACLFLAGAAEASLQSAGRSVILSPAAETTNDVLEGIARAAVPQSLPSGTGDAESEYAVDRQRMLDAEEVAIKRIVREGLAFSQRSGGN